MRGASRRAQLRLEWRDEETTVGWSDLSTATRAELRALLAEVLRHAAVGADRAEGADE
jgi:hypothetical protein